MAVFYKEFLPRSPLESLKALARGSRGQRARLNSDALRSAGIEAPESLAWGKLPRGREYLFSRAVPGCGVTDWLRERLTGRSGASLKQRRELLHGLGIFIGRLHGAGFIHGDLRTSNVMADYRGERFYFGLIDNERNQQQLPPTGRSVLRNLMQLNMLLPSDLSTRDRMRFFTDWRRQMRDLSDEEARLVAVEAYQWAMRRLRAKGKVE